jgi:subtilisin family serine protease
MNRNILILISAVCIISAICCAQAAPLPTDADRKIDPALAELLVRGGDEKIPIIVMLDDINPGQLISDGPDTDDPDTNELNEFDIKYSYRLIPGLAGEAAAKTIKKLAESDHVSGIYFDGNTQISQPGENSSPGQSLLEQGDLSTYEYIPPAQIIKADRLWEKGIDGRGTIVAVIDSGIDKNHPDLIGKVVGEKNFLADEITADDLLGHGTMVAGIIAGSGAASNGRYRGIAPGASLLSVKVIDRNGDGKVSDIIAGIEWAVYSGADILSLSLGGINLGETNPPITMASDNAASAGVVVCVAAGNRNSSEAQGQVAGSSARQIGAGNSPVNLSQSGGESEKGVYFLFVPVVLALPPGLIDSPGDGVKVITVGAADKNGHIAGFSGSGPTRDDRIKPDVVAPGVNIISTVPTEVRRPEPIEVYYSRESGTSLSAPVAAGLSALLLQADGNLTSAGVKAAMTRGARKLNNTLGERYEEYYQGAGMLDALSSYEIMQNSSDICGVVPDRWTPGRWAYLPAGKGVYVGLDTGADRPQKKVYALAPGDEDWNLRFVFFSDREIKNLKTAVKGDISGWISLQAPLKTILANDQKVFGASIVVPQNASPGSYNGTIAFSREDGDGKDGEDENLLEIPISVNVASPLNISRGVGNEAGSLKGNEWHYYYLEMMPGTTTFEATLAWQQEANQDPNLDLFLISPTSEYYTGEKGSQPEKKLILRPTFGRWLIAVHSQNSSRAVNYTLHIERYQIETVPLRWNLESAQPGTSANAQFVVRNLGLSLKNLSYTGMIENTTSQEIEGTVLPKKVWEYPVNSTESTKKLSARLLSDDRTNTSELMLVFENPGGEPVDALLGSGDLGPLEITNPEEGPWKVKVYGYEVPDVGQSFSVLLKSYAEDPWSWIETLGPEEIESNENGTIEANLIIPEDTSLSRQDGYIKISSDSHTLEIPVSLTIGGSRLEGLTAEEAIDSDGDSLFDALTLGFGLNITAPGSFNLKGVLADCNGSRIEAIDRSFELRESGSILVDVNGTDIWRNGNCGPMQIKNLILYDKSGTFVDRFEKEIIINRQPDQFQPPAAYLAGEYVNRTTPGSIAIGVNVTVTKPGRYELQGIIVNDYREELDEKSVESDLSAGNATMLLQFDPAQFTKVGENSSIHLVDLVLLRNGEELERVDYAWGTEEMDPLAFEAASSPAAGASGRPVVKLGGAGGVRMENGTAVIS